MPSIRIRDEGVRESIRQADRLLREARTRALREVGLFLEGEMKAAAPVKTGRLRSSIASKMVREDLVEVGVIRAERGGELVYAAAQEFGGKISGRPWLAIPINYPGNPVLTKAGVGGIRARDVRRSPRQFGFTSTFVRNGVIFGVKEGAKSSLRGRRGTLGPSLKANGIVPLFVLKRAVTIRGKHYVYGTFEKHEERVRRHIADAVLAAVGAE